MKDEKKKGAELTVRPKAASLGTQGQSVGLGGKVQRFFFFFFFWAIKTRGTYEWKTFNGVKEYSEWQVKGGLIKLLIQLLHP